MAFHVAIEPQSGKRYAYLMMEADEFPGWRLTLRLDDIDGALVTTEFRMTAKSIETVISARTVGSGESTRCETLTSSSLGFESSGPLPESGLSAAMFRKVALDRLVKRGLAGIDSEWAELPWNDWLSTDRSRVGRSGRDDRFYAEWAAAYVRLVTSGEPTPVIRLSEENYLSVSQVRTILGEARKRDLLSKAPAGRAGGYLTTLAELILSDPPIQEEN